MASQNKNYNNQVHHILRSPWTALVLSILMFFPTNGLNTLHMFHIGLFFFFIRYYQTYGFTRGSELIVSAPFLLGRNIKKYIFAYARKRNITEKQWNTVVMITKKLGIYCFFVFLVWVFMYAEYPEPSNTTNVLWITFLVTGPGLVGMYYVFIWVIRPLWNFLSRPMRISINIQRQ